MIKLCLSIDGANGVGKTTFIQEYIRDNTNVKYIPLPRNEKLENYEWWFKNSTPKELAYEMFLVMRERYKNVIRANWQMVVVDKGINTFIARLYATLKVRNVEEEEIATTIDYLLNLYNTMDEVKAINILFTHRYINEYESTFLDEYNRIQENYLNNLNFDAVIDNFDITRTIMEVKKATNRALFNCASAETMNFEKIEVNKKYANTIKRVATEMLRNFEEEIVLLALVGSCYFGTAIDEWSDIDFLFIVKNVKTRQDIYDLVQHEEIHIGVNCFTISEVYHNLVDIKNKWNFYFIQNGIIAPIYATEVFIPYVNRIHMVEIEDVNLKEILFLLNRFVSVHNADLRLITKKIIIALKIYLNKLGIVTSNYKEVLTNAKLKFGLCINEKMFYSKDRLYLEKVAKDVIKIYEEYTFIS